jgi:hypothetical protein
MTNEDYIDELLYEAEQLKLREYVLNSCKNLMDRNPKMERAEAIKLSLDNAKLHSGFFTKKKDE